MLSVQALLTRLEQAYGAQQWWPADGAFEVIVGAVLVQRTTWHNAAAAIGILRARGLLSCKALASARIRRLESCVRTAGFYRTKAVRLRAIARHVRDCGGVDVLAGRPTAGLRDELLGLPGIGEETADAILLYAFDRPVWVSDAYSRRLLARLAGDDWSGAHESSYVEPLVRRGNTRALKELHALVVEHGKRCCKTQPECARCILRTRCEVGRH